MILLRIAAQTLPQKQILLHSHFLSLLPSYKNFRQAIVKNQKSLALFCLINAKLHSLGADEVFVVVLREMSTPFRTSVTMPYTGWAWTQGSSFHIPIFNKENIYMRVCTKRIWVHPKWGVHGTILLVSEHVIHVFYWKRSTRIVLKYSRHFRLFWIIRDTACLRKSKIEDKPRTLNTSIVYFLYFIKRGDDVNWFGNSQTVAYTNSILKPNLCIYFVSVLCSDM